MNARRRARVIAASWAPAIFLVLITTLFGAARAIEPDPAKTSSFFREVSACLAVGLLVLASGRCAGSAYRILGKGRHRTSNLTKNLMSSVGGACREAALVCGLATPVLAASWESGGSLQQVLETTIGLGSAVIVGIVFGTLLGAMKLSPPLGICLSVTMGTLLLWPKTLGWVRGVAARFPAPEVPPGILLLVLLMAVLGTTICIYAGMRRQVIR